MKSFEIQVRVKNNRMKQRRLELGMTQAQLALACGLDEQRYGALENMKISPVLRRTGEWTKRALAVASFHGVSPDDLWPEEVLRVERSFFEAKVDVDQITSLGMDTGSHLLLADGRDVSLLARHLERLTDRERRIVEDRFGLNGKKAKTLLEAGAGVGLSPERVRQIEAKALRKLRYGILSEEKAER